MGSRVAHVIDFRPIFSLVCPSILDLWAGTGQTDRQTDSGHQQVNTAAVLGWGTMIIHDCSRVESLSRVQILSKHTVVVLHLRHRLLFLS